MNAWDVLWCFFLNKVSLNIILFLGISLENSIGEASTRSRHKSAEGAVAGLLPVGRLIGLYAQCVCAPHPRKLGCLHRHVIKGNKRVVG